MYNSKYVVIDEHTLGYITEDSTENYIKVGILNTSVIKGAQPYSHLDGWKTVRFNGVDFHNVRNATKEDFEEFHHQIPNDFYQ